MHSAWSSKPLFEVLNERQESPDPISLESGDIRIVSKIVFDTGGIEFRADSQTKTKMILIRPGDLVLSGINASKGAIAIYPDEEEQPASATIHYGAYEVNESKADKKFLWWLFRSKAFRIILNDSLPGGIKTELKAKRLLPIKIPLPTIYEQRQIVSKIERFATMIREAHDLRDKSTKELEIIIKACLNSIAENINDLGVLSEILSEKPRNGWSARCDNDPEGIPVLTLSAITGYNYSSLAFKRTSLPTNPKGHYWLKPNDLLISRSNTMEFVGHAAIYDGQPAPCIYSDLMMVVPIDEDSADKRFVWYWLQAPIVRDFIESNAKGTSPTMKKISQNTVMNIPFPVQMNIEEQRCIVAYLDSLQTKVDKLKALQTKISNELDAFMPSILDKAFKGKL